MCFLPLKTKENSKLSRCFLFSWYYLSSLGTVLFIGLRELMTDTFFFLPSLSLKGIWSFFLQLVGPAEDGARADRGHSQSTRVRSALPERVFRWAAISLSSLLRLRLLIDPNCRPRYPVLVWVLREPHRELYLAVDKRFGRRCSGDREGIDGASKEEW